MYTSKRSCKVSQFDKMKSNGDDKTRHLDKYCNQLYNMPTCNLFDCCVALDDIQITFQSFHFHFFKHQRCHPNKLCLVICSRAAVSQSNHIINMFQEEMKKKMSSVLCCTVSKGLLALLMLMANKNYARSFWGVFLWQSYQQ